MTATVERARIRYAEDRSSLRTVLDLAVATMLAIEIFAAAAGSSVEPQLVAVAKPAKWLILYALVVLVLVRALAFRSEWRFRPWVAAGLLGFCALCLVSREWSVYPRITLDRTVSTTLVIFACGTAAGSIAASPKTGQRILDAVLVAAAAVALAGLILWLADPSHAVQAASTQYPARFQGLEENPNTAPMLLAIAMPLALSRALAASNKRVRAVLLVTLLALATEIAASGSRGGLAAGFSSLLVVAVLEPARARHRIAAALAVLVSLAVAAWATTVPRALPTQATTAQPQSTVPTPSRPLDAEIVIPLSGEIGGPWWTHTSGAIHRTLFSSSTRTRAWRGAIERGLERPILGYGFGAEQGAFINRYYGFNSGNPENGYIGLFLQIGVVGLVMFVVIAGLCLACALRHRMRNLRVRGGVASGAIAASVAGLILGLSQSYFHAAGNIAYVAFWTVLLVTSVYGIRSTADGDAPRH